MQNLLGTVRRKSGLDANPSHIKSAVMVAAREVTTELPPSIVETVTATVSLKEGESYTLDGDIPVSAYVEKTGKRLVQVPRSQVLDDDSRRLGRLRRNGRGAWYVHQGAVQVLLPHEDYIKKATLHYIPELGFDELDEPPFGPQWAEVLSTHAALQLLNEEAGRVRANTTLVDMLGDPPTAPSAPSISYTDASAVAPTSTTISSLPSVPQLASLTRSIEGAPSLSDLDLGTQIDNTTSLSPRPTSTPRTRRCRPRRLRSCKRRFGHLRRKQTRPCKTSKTKCKRTERRSKKKRSRRA